MRDERTLRPKRLRPCECCRRATRTGESALAFVLDDRGQLHRKYEEHKRQASPMFKSAECRSQSRVWHSRPFDFHGGAREHNRHSEITTRRLTPDPAALGTSRSCHSEPKVRIFAVERN